MMQRDEVAEAVSSAFDSVRREIARSQESLCRKLAGIGVHHMQHSTRSFSDDIDVVFLEPTCQIPAKTKHIDLAQDLHLDAVNIRLSMDSVDSVHSDDFGKHEGKKHHNHVHMAFDEETDHKSEENGHGAGGAAHASDLLSDQSTTVRPNVRHLCIKCNSIMKIDACFCRQCGALRSNSCLHCYNILATDAWFCRKCGTRRMSQGRAMQENIMEDILDRQKPILAIQFNRLDQEGNGYLSIASCMRLITDYNPGAVTTYERLREALRRWAEFSSADDTVTAGQFSEQTFMTINQIRTDDNACRHMGHPIYQLRFAFIKEQEMHDLHCKRIERNEKELENITKQVTFKKQESIYDIVDSHMADAVSGSVIVLNLFVLGISSDLAPDSVVWNILEIFFTGFFTVEIIFRLRTHGCTEVGWLFFDALVVVIAITELLIVYIIPLFVQDEGGFDLQVILLIKVLRLVRLSRLVRLIRIKAFKELRQMLEGIVSGLNVLIWAFVLLGLSIFCVATASRTLIGTRLEEFSSLNTAALTVFRCVTDGCTRHDGTPLQEELNLMYGIPFTITYYISYLTITIGLFNLIMSIFIQSILDCGNSQLQVLLGEQRAVMQYQLTEYFAYRFVEHRVGSDEFAGRDEVFDHFNKVPPGHRIVPKELFEEWLCRADMDTLLEDVKVDPSSKNCLFDALDMECRGELDINTIVTGIMHLRGPISKLDVVGSRLKIMHLLRLTMDICYKLGIRIDEYQLRTSDMFGMF